MAMSSCGKCGTAWSASLGLPMCPVCGGPVQGSAGGAGKPGRPASTKTLRRGRSGPSESPTAGSAVLDRPSDRPKDDIGFHDSALQELRPTAKEPTAPLTPPKERSAPPRPAASNPAPAAPPPRPARLPDFDANLFYLSVAPPGSKPDPKPDPNDGPPLILDL